MLTNWAIIGQYLGVRFHTQEKGALRPRDLATHLFTLGCCISFLYRRFRVLKRGSIYLFHVYWDSYHLILAVCCGTNILNHLYAQNESEIMETDEFPCKPIRLPTCKWRLCDVPTVIPDGIPWKCENRRIGATRK